MDPNKIIKEEKKKYYCNYYFFHNIRDQPQTETLLSAF